MNITKNIKFASLAFVGIVALTSVAGNYDLYEQITEKVNKDGYAVAKESLNTPELMTQYLEEFLLFYQAKFQEDGKYFRLGEVKFLDPQELIKKIARSSSDPYEFCFLWDDKLSKVGYCSFSARLLYYEFFPKCTENLLTQTDFGKKYVRNHPVLVSAIRNSKKYANMSFPEKINIYVETASNCEVLLKTKEVTFNNYMNDAVKIIKRKIRKDGKSFVVGEDGVNHVQNAIDALTSALQAPKCSGTKEWIAEWCPEYTWVECTWPTDEEIAKLKNDVMYGEIELTEAISQKLLFNLGLDEYNKFIKEYNGD